MPVVIRAMVGAGFRAAAQHSQMLTPLFVHIPGLKVVCPSNAYDAKGLLIQSIRDNDPVIFCEHKNLYATEADVPAESYAIPFGEANVVREGKHATIITYGMMVNRAMDAAAALAKNGTECEVVDLRTLSPIDWDTIIDSASKTGQVVCVDEAHPRCSIASDATAAGPDIPARTRRWLLPRQLQPLLPSRAPRRSKQQWAYSSPKTCLGSH